MKLKNLLGTLKRIFTHAYSPYTCFACGNPLVDGELQICRACLFRLPSTTFERYNNNKAEMRFWGRIKMETGFSAYFYRKEQTLQRVIHAFKYHNNKEMAIAMGREIGIKMAKNAERFAKYDYLVPVPLHPKKIKLRGYNQALLIAQGISEITDIQINDNILKRSHFSTSQTKKHKFERWSGVEDSFEVCGDPQQWVGSRILLIDDVLTTGATLESCGKALQIIPEVKIGFATLAIADGD